MFFMNLVVYVIKKEHSQAHQVLNKEIVSFRSLNTQDFKRITGNY
jgi:hypothetical protein